MVPGGSRTPSCLVLYTATAVQGLPLGLSQSEGPLYRILSYVHLVGIVLQPILGLITAYPEVIGINPGAQERFGGVMRTIHMPPPSTALLFALCVHVTLARSWRGQAERGTAP